MFRVKKEYTQNKYHEDDVCIYMYYVKHALYAASQKGYPVISIVNSYTLQLC